MPTNILDRSLGGGDFSTHLSPQTTSGTANATPEFFQVRRTDGGINKVLARVQSGEVKTNRQGRQNIDDTSDLTSDMSTELTQQTISKILPAAIHSAVDSKTAGAVTTIESTATGFTDSGTGFADYEQYDWFYIQGFADSTIDGWYRIETKTSSSEVVTSTAPSAVEASGASILLECEKYASGAVQTLFTGQQRVADESAGGTDYKTYIDGVLNTFGLTIGESGIVTSEFNLAFESQLDGNTIVAGQTDSVADNSDVIGSGGDKFMYPIFVNGVNTGARVKSFGLSVDNAYQQDRSAGVNGASQALSDPTYTCDITARSMLSDSLYWESLNFSGTRFGLAIVIKWPDNKECVIDVPASLITDFSQDKAANVIATNTMTLGLEESATTGDTVRLFTNDWS